MENLMQSIVSLSKRKGFIYPGSEIYGGFANTWDYGPYGSLLKKNIKDFWWKTFVQEREDIVGLDSSILMNPKIWEASGHVQSFSDPLMDCKNCQERVRGDKLIEETFGLELFSFVENEVNKIKDKKESEIFKNYIENHSGKSIDWCMEEIVDDINKRKKDPIKLVNFLIKLIPSLKCPKCGKSEFTEARSFNLMFKTHQGVIENESAELYLRPETAQGIFVNFKNVTQSTRVRIPFGIAQIGKAFRNEITPGNFTFRTREFEQMEIEYFINPEPKENIKTIFDDWKKACWQWYLDLGVKEENLRYREHAKDELSHYSSMTFDIEYKFPFGWGELMGLAYRGNYDLSQHEKFSGEKLQYLDPLTNERCLPHVIEPSFGADRSTLITLIDAYDEDEVEGEKRTVMRFSPKIAPIKAAVFPLIKKPELTKLAQEIYSDLKQEYQVEYDESAAIGKRYRRQDEIGTPYCVTIDFDSLQDKKVTLRDRDTTKQERVKIDKIKSIIQAKIN